MATTKITDLTAYTDPVNTDVLPIVDVTSDVTKKVSIANVMKNASLGSASAPGVAFDGDPNTGIYSPGADQVAVSTGGTQRLLIDSSGAVTIAGDLTVNGTTTNINTQNLVVEDKNVVLGDVATPTDVTADGGGITLKGTTDKTINWVDATDAWTSSEHINIASGKEYRIAGTKVLDATSLGSSVLITSANITDGTIVNGDINASAAIAGTKISPDFGSQNVTTTGTVTGASLSPTSSTAPTNGVYLPAANTVGISTGGSGRLFVDSTGRVGIANSSPARALDITGTLRCSGRFESSSDAIISDWIYIGSASGARGVTSDAAIRPLLFGINGSEVARFDTSGRLGVGSSAPQELLNVNGNILVGVDGTATASEKIIRSSNTSTSFGNDSGANLVLQSGAGTGIYGSSIQFRTPQPSSIANTLGTQTTRMTIDTQGRVGIGVTPSYLLHVDSSTTTNTAYIGNGYGGLVFGCNNSGERIINTNSTGPIVFQRGGSETARFDSSGRFGVGLAPATHLDVQATTTASSSFGLRVAAGTNSADYCAKFNNAVGTTLATIDGSGRLLVGNISATANGGVLQVSNGITFPATQSACSDANTLDDYEEGTWTPTLTSSSGSFGTITYTVQSGSYTKIGDLVFLRCNFYTSSVSVGTASGEVRVSGLPFVSAALSSATLHDVRLWTTNPSTGASISGSIVFLFKRGSYNGDDTNLTPSDVRTTNPGNLCQFSGCYKVN